MRKLVATLVVGATVALTGLAGSASASIPQIPGSCIPFRTCSFVQGGTFIHTLWECRRPFQLSGGPFFCRSVRPV